MNESSMGAADASSFSVASNRRAPPAVGQAYDRALHLRVGGIAEQQAIIARLDVPIVAGRFVGCEQARIDGELDVHGLAGFELGLGKPAKAFGRFPANFFPVGG